MTDNKLRLDLAIVGTDQASQAVDDVVAAVARLPAALRKAGEAATATSTGIDALVASMRALKDAMADSASSIIASASRMRSAVVGDIEEIRAASRSPFKGMASAARSETAEAARAVTTLKADMATQFEAIRSSGATAFAPLSEGAASASEGVAGAMTRIDAAITATLTKVRDLGAELKALASIKTETSSIGIAGRGRRSTGASSKDDVHFGRVGTHLPGGAHASIGGNAVLAGAGVLAYGAFEAAMMRDEIARLAITGQVKPEDYGQTAEQMKTFLQGSASSTGFSVSEVAEALVKGERSMQGLDVKTKLSTTKELMPYAAAEARLKETSLAESLSAMVEMAHMTGTYKPEDLRELARKFGFVSLSTNSSLPGFAKTLSYSLPELRAGMGMDPDTIMALTATAQNAGITSTKSGTWLRSFFEGVEPQQGQKGEKHNKGLRTLGLLDEQDKPTWKVYGQDGKMDWSKSTIAMAEAITKNIKGVDEDHRMGLVKSIFGERGGAMADMLSMNTFIEQFATLSEKIKGFKGGSDALEDYAKNSPVQQARETWRDTQNVLIDIGTVALPAVNSALRDFDTLVKSIGDAINGQWQSLAKLIYKQGIEPDVKPLVDFLGGAGAGPNNKPQTQADKIRDMRGELDAGKVAADAKLHLGIMPSIDAADAIRKAARSIGIAPKPWWRRIFGDASPPNIDQPKAATTEDAKPRHRAVPADMGPTPKQDGAQSSAPTLDASKPVNAARAAIARNIGIVPAVDPAGMIQRAADSLGILRQQEDSNVWILGALGTSAGVLKASFGDLSGRSSGLVDGLRAFADAITAATSKLAALAGFGGSGGSGGAGDIGSDKDNGKGGIVQASYDTGDSTAISSASGARAAQDGAPAQSSITGTAGKGDAAGIALGLTGANSRQAAAALRSQMTPGEWCADFVNGIIKSAGGKGVNSSMAAAFAGWGRSVGLAAVKRGDVILERHGNRIGHVGIATGPAVRDKNGNIIGVPMVSGNYGHRVNTNLEPLSKIAGFRRGQTQPAPADIASQVHHRVSPTPAPAPAAEHRGRIEADAGTTVHAPVTINVHGAGRDHETLARVISREFENTINTKAYDVDHDVG